MINTEQHFIWTNRADELICASCKHIKIASGEEPCKSCFITNYEPIVADKKTEEK